MRAAVSRAICGLIRTLSALSALISRLVDRLALAHIGYKGHF